jgi:hypothetical protein
VGEEGNKKIALKDPANVKIIQSKLSQDRAKNI